MPTSSESTSYTDGLFKRIALNVLVWALIGIAVGIVLSPPDSNFIRILAGAVAGLIVLPGIGLIAGLLGSKPTMTIFATVFAGLMMYGVAMFNPNLNQHFLLGFSLVLGALIGSTFSVFYRFTLWFLSQLRMEN